jgi:hypothetical protein
MVSIKKWYGRFGNNLFQYVAARLLAERNNLFLELEWPQYHDNVLHLINWENNGMKILDPIEPVNDDTYLETHKNHIILDGYFQQAQIYNNYRDKIRSWFEPCIFPQNTKDWVINYRVSDYWKWENVINYTWYIDILKLEGYFSSNEKAYIVTEDPNDKMVIKLKNEINGEIVRAEGHIQRSDFNFIRSFDKIINANGTFSWWASFLGKPRKNYFFKRWIRDYRSNSLPYMIDSIAIDGKYVVE